MRQPQAQIALSGARMCRASVLRLKGRYEDAIQEWSRLLELDLGADRLATQISRASAMAQAGHHREAAAELAKLVPSAKGDNFSLYRMAAVYGFAAVAAGFDATLPQAERQRVARQHGDAAIPILEQLASAGYFQDPMRRRQLQTDLEFQTLRPREDFQQLLERLAPKPAGQEKK